jgi:glycosyltransferase involved in cell wall biosynthesis
LVGTAEVDSLVQHLSTGFFDLVIQNDLDFAGHDELFDALSTHRTPLVWDLHEFFPDLGGGFFWKITQARYHSWLFEKLRRREVSRFLTVSQEIAELYRRYLTADFSIISNAPKLGAAQARVESRGPEQPLRLLYHGAIGSGRGLARVIYAMRFVREGVTLSIIAVGSKFQIAQLNALVKVLRLESRISFLPRVPFEEIVSEISQFDCEVIFYHPPHSTNERYSLPNKFFESMAAGLGIIVGQSPSMSEIVLREGNGIVVDGWSARALASAVSAISPNEANEFRRRSLEAFPRYSADNMKKIFIEAIADLILPGEKAQND